MNSGGKVKVRGKTGERLVPFVMAEPYIKNSGADVSKS